VIDRYCSREMNLVWCDANKVLYWAAVEIEVMKAQGQLGIVPPDMHMHLELTLRPSLEQVRAQEETLRHDLMAFLAAWKENTEHEGVHRWLHYGLTSSDVVETAQALILTQANVLIGNAGYTLLADLIAHATEHRGTIRQGRTHGQAAEPTSWGYRVADIALALARSLDRFVASADQVRVGHVSGPLGNYVHVPRDVEIAVCSALGLNVPDSSTQVLMRDSLGAWAYSLANVVTVCEALALEIRHGQRSEVAEIFEGTAKGQRGSSSMPHKRNPITAEKVSGLARLARSYVMPITEGIALWHERDISHSSVERVALPDLCAITEHVLLSTSDLVSRLDINHEGMRRNIKQEGTTTKMNRLIREGLSRDQAYEQARKLGFVESCPAPQIDHTFEALARLRAMLAAAAAQGGVSL